MLVAACVKYVDLRPQVDRLTGHVTDGGADGWSLADLAAVREVERDLVGLVDHLVAPVPVSARGVALVHEMLVDGSGPLYLRRSPRDLSEMIRTATLALDPDADWPAAA